MPDAVEGDTLPEPVTAQPTAKLGPLKRLYLWVMSWAETPYAVPALFLLALAESSFFPIPPDVLLLALALSVPTWAFRYAAWCTAGSVIGGVVGYFLGMALWGSIEPFMFEWVMKPEKFEHVMGIYRDYGVEFVFVAAFTPIPYKVFTIAAGVAKVNLPMFVVASILGRGARFFLLATMLRYFGDRAKDFIDKYFGWVTLAAGLLLVGAFVALKLL